ncbi:MAG: hypothetical protein O3A63_21360 [Proteobacteria bacterium]|nr:hypothetical protein [Pseudomonadota bacterium]
MSYTHPEYLISTDELDSILPSADLLVLDATVYLLPGEKGYRIERPHHVGAVAVYDGSISQWAADPDAPMEVSI